MRRALAITLALLLTPASGILVENAVHLLAEGHLAHAVDDAAHAPDSPEHGCTSVVHVCPCHTSPSFTTNDGTASSTVVAVEDTDAAPLRDGDPTIGHRTPVFRPPIG